MPCDPGPIPAYRIGFFHLLPTPTIPSPVRSFAPATHCRLTVSSKEAGLLEPFYPQIGIKAAVSEYRDIQWQAMMMITIKLLLTITGLSVFSIYPLLQMSENKLEQLGPPRIIPLRQDFHHVQGIDVNGDRIYISSVDRKAQKGYLQVLSLSTREVLLQVEVQQGEKYHPGGISLDSTSVWIPVAEYRRSSTSVIERRDKKTLAIIGSFDVPDHIGCVAIDQNRIFGGNWDSREIYCWDLTGRLLWKTDSPSPVAYQDMKFIGGQLIGSGVIKGAGGAIDWLDMGSLQIRKRLHAGMTDRNTPMTNEGMTIRDGLLYLLPEDAPSRIFVFRAWK
jgi:hypothetical protein